MKNSQIYFPLLLILIVFTYVVFEYQINKAALMDELKDIETGEFVNHERYDLFMNATNTDGIVGVKESDIHTPTTTEEK